MFNRVRRIFTTLRIWPQSVSNHEEFDLSKVSSGWPNDPHFAVLHTPHGIAGNAFRIAEEERAAGLGSDLVVFEDSSFQFSRHGSLGLEKLPSPGLRRARIETFLAQAVLKYQVFHFNFGASLLHQFPDVIHEDFKMLKSSGKAIFVTYQGCDARDKDLSIRELEINMCVGCDYYSCDDRFNKFKRDAVRIALKYADGVYFLNPDLARSINGGKFQPYASVDAKALSPVPFVEKLPHEIIIAHAPTSRALKGTVFIEAVLESLKHKYNCKILLIEGLSHAEALAQYRKADIVIDQILAGWYGAFAVECMALGKPTVAYIREGDLNVIPDEMRRDMGVFNANQRNLFERLSLLIENGNLRKEWGTKARAYVLKHHDPSVITADLVKDYTAALARINNERKGQ